MDEESTDAATENPEDAADAKEEAEETAEADAEADAEEMTEQTPEEAEEEKAENAEDAQEAVSESAGNLLLGFFRGKRKRRRRHHGHIRRCVNAAKPLAGQIDEASNGAIKARHLLGAVGLIAKAKKGSVKAKRGIKAVVKLAAKPGPKQAPAKKATAKLKIAHAIMKKTGTAKGLPAPKKAAPFTQPVMVRNSGLDSYSSYQRGMAMIPGFARSHFGS